MSGTITVVERRADDPERATDRNNKQAIFKNYTPFSDWITVYRLYSDEISNTQVDNAKDLDVIIPIYN